MIHSEKEWEGIPIIISNMDSTGTFEMFLKATNNHKRANILYDPSHFVLQQLDYITYIDHYHEFIKAFHVKDSEFKPNGKKGAFGGYGTWKDRAGRYRSPGDGQIDFKTIFTKEKHYNPSRKLFGNEFVFIKKSLFVPLCPTSWTNADNKSVN